MKREGRQHGAVRSTKHTADVAAGKAPAKPTGQSRHTGKCRKARCAHCHSHPVSKSRDKAKGAHKLRSGDVVLNHRLVSWRVVDEGWRPALSGASATGVLDALLTGTESCWSQGDVDDGSRYQERDDQQFEYGGEYGDGIVESSNNCNQQKDEDEDDEEDMGFCEVGFVLDCADEEGWCLVDEIIM